MRIHVSSGRKKYNPQPGDVKETRDGRFRRVPRLAWRGRFCIGRQVSGSRPLYDWIEDKYYDRFGNHYRSSEWWELRENQ